MSSRAAALAPGLLLVLASAACGGGGAAVAHFQMEDLPAPAMFEQLAQGLKKAYVVELPAEPVDKRFALQLEGVSEREVLEQIVKLDPAFDFDLRDDVLVLHPRARGTDPSPFVRPLGHFEAKGGASDVVHQIVAAAGLEGSTVIQASLEGARRPVQLNLEHGTVRDALAEVAAQAHVGMRNEPGYIRMFQVGM